MMLFLEISLILKKSQSFKEREVYRIPIDDLIGEFINAENTEEF